MFIDALKNLSAYVSFAWTTENTECLELCSSMLFFLYQWLYLGLRVLWHTSCELDVEHRKRQGLRPRHIGVTVNHRFARWYELMLVLTTAEENTWYNIPGTSRGLYTWFSMDELLRAYSRHGQGVNTLLICFLHSNGLQSTR